MSQTTLQGNWNELKGKAKQRWGKLTDSDLDQIGGRNDQLLGKVQRAYGLTREEAQQQVNAFEEDCGCRGGSCGASEGFQQRSQQPQSRGAPAQGRGPEQTGPGNRGNMGAADIDDEDEDTQDRETRSMARAAGAGSPDDVEEEADNEQSQSRPRSRRQDDSEE